MSADRLHEAAKVLRERAEAATPGPWEVGNHWHIQGTRHCACRDGGDPHERKRLINGKMMLSHAHRQQDSTWPHGIFTTDLQADGFPWAVFIDSDEYGRASDADASYVATMHPGVGLALADWLDVVANTSAPTRAGFREALVLADLILGGDA